MNYRSLLAAIALAAGALLALPSAGEASYRNVNIVQCVLTQGADIDNSPDSLIWSCCLSDGCVICGAGWTDCKWEQARDTRWPGSIRPKTFGVTQGSAASVDPGPSMTQPRPRWLGTGKFVPAR